jgi:HTH-type transcriptional regulator / antitoxin HigA
MGHESDGSTRRASAPGEAVREAMERLGWSQSDLGYALGVTTATVNQIVTGKRGISPAMAKALGRALDIQPETLATMQAAWELKQAEEPAAIVDTRARIQSRFPLREMIKRGWLPETDRPEVLKLRAREFFGVQSLDEVPRIAHAAKRSSPGEINGSQLAWLFRVRQIAQQLRVPQYAQSQLKQALDRLSEARAEPERVRFVPRVLQEAGIRFVIVESLPSSDIDGVCLWLDGRSPIIGMSLRFDRIDNFWFVLAHECAHVLHGHGKDAVMVDSDLAGTIGREVNESEKIANDQAAEFCVPQDKMKSFYLRKNPLFSERDVLAFAKRMDVHPGLVVGQLQWETGRYELLRRHLAKVRDHLSLTMMLDGWGDVLPVVDGSNA